MNVAIVGTGVISYLHANAIKSLSHNIKLAIDANEDAAEKFANIFGADEHSSDFSRALGAEIDCIHICTPPTLHFEMVKAALNANKHVICEKPLCLKPEEAKELMKLAEEKNLVNAVNFNIRFWEACKRAQNAITHVDFGKLRLVSGSYMQEFHALPAEYSWRYDDTISGKMRATTEIGSHLIDIIRFLTGNEVIQVSANYGCFNRNRYLKDGVMYSNKQEGAREISVESDDVAIVSLRFSDGSIGNFLLSEISHGRNNRCAFEIVGDKQSVWWDSENPFVLSHAQKSTGVNSRVNAFGDGFADTFTSLIREAYSDILSSKKSDGKKYPTFKDGYINSLVCKAIYDSAKNESRWTEVKYV